MNGVKDVFKRFIPYFKDYIPQFALAIIGMIMASVGTAVSAYLVKPVLDKIFVEKTKVCYICFLMLLLLFIF